MESADFEAYDANALALTLSSRDMFDIANKINIIPIPRGQGEVCEESMALSLADSSQGLGQLFSPPQCPVGHGSNYLVLGRRAISTCIQVYETPSEQSEGRFFI